MTGLSARREEEKEGTDKMEEQQVPASKIHELIACAVCLETVKNSKLLPCQHSFCASCLTDLSIECKIKCPLCRQEHSISDVARLPTDFMKNSLLAIVEQEKHFAQGFLCSSCDESDDEKAVSYCHECGLFFCEDHQKAHLKDRYTKGHKVVPVSKIEFQDIKPSFPMHCNKHNERLKFFLRSKGKALREQQHRLEASLVMVEKECEQADKALTKGIDEDVLSIKGTLLSLQKEVSKIAHKPQNDDNLQLTFNYMDYRRTGSWNLTIEQGRNSEESILLSVNSMFDACFNRRIQIASLIPYLKGLEKERRLKEEERRQAEEETRKRGFLDSILLNEKQIALLREWQGNPQQGWSLLYRGSRDGFDGAQFHAKCNNKGPTFVLVRSNTGFLFGGYTPISWTSRNGYAWDNRTFIFTLTNPHGIQPTKYNNNGPHYNNQQRIYDAPAYGPTFGGGHDFHVATNGHLNTNSYTNFPYAFSDTTGKGNNTFTGSRNFQVAEVEVFGQI